MVMGIIFVKWWSRIQSILGKIFVKWCT